MNLLSCKNKNLRHMALRNPKLMMIYVRKNFASELSNISVLLYSNVEFIWYSIHK